MAITESRVKDGVLSLGTTPLDFSCQVTNVKVGTTYSDDGDSVETLCGDQIAPGRKRDNQVLSGTFIQDWTLGVGSITDYLWTHELEVVTFTYTPNGDAGPTLTGSVRLEIPAESYGGDVNTRITSDFEWGIIGDVTRTPPVVAMAAEGEVEGDSET